MRWTSRDVTRLLATVLVCATIAPGCGALSLRDAVPRLASARGCRGVEVSAVEMGDGLYEESGCGDPARLRCDGDGCDEAGGGGGVAGRIVAGQHALQRLQPDVLRCTGGERVVVQLFFDPFGALVGTRIAGAGTSCVRDVVAEVHIGEGEGGVVVSRAFGQ